MLWLAVCSTILAALIAVTGGFTLDVAGLSISMHAVTRPVVVAVAFGLLSVYALRAFSRADANRLYLAVCRDAVLIAGAFALAVGVAAYSGGAHVASGADASGYLSQARLWRETRAWNLAALRRTTPIARELTPMNRQYVFTPVGYQPGGADTIVPGYPPGLPIHFAIAGERAQFAVVPLAAAGLVMVAFFLGLRLGGSVTALLSAFTVGSSPMLLYEAAQPMSDVVAAFWWSLAVLRLLDPSKR